jgi:hypothetical protein
VQSAQKLTIFKWFISFTTVILAAVSVFGYLMFIHTEIESLKQLIINTIFVGICMHLITSVSTAFLAYTDASKDDENKEFVSK